MRGRMGWWRGGGIDFNVVFSDSCGSFSGAATPGRGFRLAACKTLGILSNIISSSYARWLVYKDVNGTLKTFCVAARRPV